MAGAAPSRLPRRFYRTDATSLGRALLGQLLVRRVDGTRLAGRIVETEAYLGEADAAAHTYRGRRTKRNASMFLDAGHAYVYFTYGMHHCLNVVADAADVPTACLIRAVEPTEGAEAMRVRRAGKIPAERLRPVNLASGPAKLCQALSIDRTLDGEDLTRSGRLHLQPGPPVDPAAIVTTARVGVAYAGSWAETPLRFYESGNPHVSKR